MISWSPSDFDSPDSKASSRAASTLEYRTAVQWNDRSCTGAKPAMKLSNEFRFLTTLPVFVLLFACCDRYEPPVEEQSRPTIERKQPDAGAKRVFSGDSANDSTGASNTSEHAEESELPTLDEAMESKTNLDSSEQAADPEPHTIDIPEAWRKLSPNHEIWLDMEKKQVIAGGHICLNAGPLEVFVCPRHTKEHESVISIKADAEQVHAALLAIGANPGKPVQWIEEYKPATGDVIAIDVMWKEGEKIIKRPGQEMILNSKTGNSMQHDWVFGGSIIETIEATEDTPERSFYLANSGELVCVSNFSTATLDVPVKSSDANEGLLYEANTPNVPAIGTRVYVVFSKKK